MNGTIRRAISGVGLVLALGGSVAQAASFTYHGSLNDGGQPANGRYDLRLTPYASEKAAAASAEAVTLYGVDVEDGRFSTEVDFGGVAVNEGWIGVAVRKAGGGDFTDLAGRSQINGDGACWSTTGNAGTTPGANYVGTSDNQPLIFKVNGGVAGAFVPYGPDQASFNMAGASSSASRSFAINRGSANASDSFAGGYSGVVSAGHDRSFVWGGTNRAAALSSGHADQFAIWADGGVAINGSNNNTAYELTVRAGGAGAPGGLDANMMLKSDSGKEGRIYVGDANGQLVLEGSSGVHISNPVGIDGDLSVNGNATKSTAGAWQANSDGRIKQDIQPIDGALDTLAKVHPVSFRYTDAYRAEHPQVADQRYYNVIAQQFAEVFPDAVTKSGQYLPGAEKTADNEILRVDTYPAQIVTIAAVQELAQRNAALEATVQRLTTRLAKLEAAKGK